jgi:hypothetical protein
LGNETVRSPLNKEKEKEKQFGQLSVIQDRGLIQVAESLGDPYDRIRSGYAQLPNWASTCNSKKYGDRQPNRRHHITKGTRQAS